MWHPQMGRRLLALLLLASGAACTSWRPAPPDTRAMLEERRPRQARVTLSDGEQLVIERPVVRADSIVGSEETSEAGAALSDVRFVEVPGIHPGALLSAGLVAAGIVIALIIVDEDHDAIAGAAAP